MMKTKVGKLNINKLWNCEKDVIFRIFESTQCDKALRLKQIEFSLLEQLFKFI